MLVTPTERVLREVSAVMSTLEPVTSLSVAFSGGADSTVLLDALRRLCPQFGLPVPRALHIDHGLELCSAEWSSRCEQFCVAHGVEFRSISVDARARSGQSPEEVARTARYQALRAAMRPDEVLCVAHHADDQAETTLLQMLRGAGVLGGGAMRAQGDFSPGRLLRPMLNLRRRDIESYARSRGLAWINDPANQRARHPRNRLRAEVLPLLQDIAPGAVEALSRAALLQREAADAVDELARLDLQRCWAQQRGSLSRTALRTLSSARRRAVLRTWLRNHVRMPSYRRLGELERQICTARHDAAPRLAVGTVRIELHGDSVLLFASPPPALESGETHTWDLHCGVLQLPHGRLSAQQRVGRGLRGDAPITVRMRCGGERCRPHGRAHSQTVKRLLQAHRVPAWQRHGLPLLYRGLELVAVADLWVCEGHAAAADEPGWEVQWQHANQPWQAEVP
ncbi:MAG: tRNA(Ile)-lysidine synthase [Gammaproteobacteria bacterium]|jgi:tRNA(Ile)-lysidine synthase